jgi:hypothetical protein
MAQKTDLELIAEANVIRDETAIGANTALRIGTMLDNLVDSKINNDRVSDSTSLGNSTTLVPSQNAVKTYVDAFATGLLTDNGNYDPTITSEYPTSGDTLSGGAVQRGDIWYISVDGTMNGNAVLVGYSVRALVDNAGATTDANWSISNVGIGFVPENVANKSTDVNLGTSDVYYPSQNAVKTYVDTEVAAAVPFTPENVANKSQDIVSSPSSTVLYPSNKAVADYIAYGVDLQAVTDSGNITTNDVHIQNIIDSSNATDSGAAYLNNVVGDGGIVGIKKADGTTGEIKATNLTANRDYELPNTSGTLALLSNISTPSLQDVVAVNASTTLPFGCAGATGASITASSTSDSSAASIEAYTGAGGSVVITNENGSASQIRATDLTAFRTHQLPDADGILALQSYKIYTALLNFDGTTVSAIVLQNTLGVTLNWTNPINGYFRGTASSGTPFTTNKTWIIVQNYNNAGQPYIPTAQPRNAFPTTTIDILMYLYDGTLTGTPNVSKLPIEIRVYP